MRREPAVRAHDAAAGMRGRAAHPQVLDGRLVLRVAGHGTQEEQLLERELALEDVAFGQSQLAFEIERRDHLPADDDVLDVGREFGDGVDDVVAELFPLLVPRAFFQLVGRVLHEARHHVLARRRDRRVGQAGNHHVDVRPARVAPVLGIVVGALHVIDAGRNRNCAAQMLPFSGHAGEVGQRIEREVHLARRAAVFVALHFLAEVVGQVLGVDHLQEREVGIDAR